jgi:hypothetical protein
MASLTLSLAAALTACWSAAPQPITSVTQTINEGFQVTNVQAFNTGVNSQAATGATGSSTGISINFDQPVNRASVERSINIFDGEINPALNPKKITKLGLTSMCNGTWRVRNANTSPIAFTWDIRKDSEREDNDEHDDDDKHRKGLEQGTGMVPANADVMLQTSSGPHSLRLLVGNKNQQSKHATRTACNSSPMTFAWAADSKSVVASPKTALVLNKTYSVVVSTFAKNSSGSLALSVPFVSKVVVKENSSTSGTLMPGGSWTSRDGVKISAPGGTLLEPIKVFAQTIQSTSLVVPLPSGYSVVSPFYEIGSESRIDSANGAFFKIGIPMVPNVPEDELGLLTLNPSYEVDTESSGADFIWLDSGFIFDATENTVNVYSTALLDKNSVFVLVRRVANTSSLSLNQTKNILPQSIYPEFSFECTIFKKNDCPSTLFQDGYTEFFSAYGKYSVEFSLSVDNVKPLLSSARMIKCGANNVNNGGYDVLKQQISICLEKKKDGSYDTKEGDYRDTIKHEVFHSVQRIWVKSAPRKNMTIGEINNLFLSRKWIMEGTARAVEKSTISQMNVNEKTIPRLNTVDLKAAGDLYLSEYKTQDFWVFAGQKNNYGYINQKQIFLTGLENPAEDVDSSIEYEGKLKKAYWDWSKNQGYEWNPNFRADKSPCQIDSKTTYPDFADNRFKTDLSSPLVIASQPVNSLTTRVIPIRFTNTDSRSVKVTLEATSATATPLNYKIYEGTVPSTQTDCTNDPEGTFQNGTKAEILETVSNKTELVIFVANTDFVNPSSFTVKVEAVAKITTPNIKQQTPNGLQDLTDNVTFTATRGQAVNTTLVLTNQGEIGSSMGYIIYPLGNQVTSGVSVASIRNPISTPTGTVSTDVWDSSLFRTRSGTLRHPDDLDTNNGENQAVIPIQATCPDAQVSLSEIMTLVYTTGAMDDFGTPDDPSDDEPELEIFPITVKLDCVGQRISEDYFVKSDKSILQWAMKAHGNNPASIDYQQRCYPAPPQYVEAPIPDLRGLLVANPSVGIYLFTDDGSKWSLRRYRLDSQYPTEIMWDSQLISGPNQTIGTSSLRSRLQSTDRDRSREQRVTYFYSLEQFKKNRVQAKGYFAGTLLTIAANSTVWGAGDDSFGQASGNGQAYQNGVVRTVPVLQQIPGPTNIIEVYGSYSYGMALSKTGDVWLWGSVHQCEQDYYGLTPRIIANIN